MRLYAQVVGELLERARAPASLDPGDRRTRPDGASPAAGVRRHRLHAAAVPAGPAGGAHRHRRGGRLPQPRCGGRRPGRAAGAVFPPGAVQPRRRNRGRAQYRRHLQPHAAARRRHDAGLRLRSGQRADGRLVRAAHWPGLRRRGIVGGLGQVLPGCSRPCWRSLSSPSRRPRARAATCSARPGCRTACGLRPRPPRSTCRPP